MELILELLVQHILIIDDINNSTEIILNEKMETIKFGHECQKYLGEINSSRRKILSFYWYKNEIIISRQK